MSAKACLRSLAQDESGATAIEYALIAGIIAIAIVASLTSLTTELQTAFSNVATGLSNALN